VFNPGHYIGRSLFFCQLVGHVLHVRMHMPEEYFVCSTQLIQAFFSVRSFLPPVLRTLAMAGEAVLTLQIITGKGCQLCLSELQLFFKTTVLYNSMPASEGSPPCQTNVTTGIFCASINCLINSSRVLLTFAGPALHKVPSFPDSNNRNTANCRPILLVSPLH